jgi:hypothetical protein
MMYSYWLDKNNSLTPSGGRTQRANHSIHPDVYRLAEYPVTILHYVNTIFLLDCGVVFNTDLNRLANVIGDILDTLKNRLTVFV